MNWHDATLNDKEVGMADEESAPGNLITQIWKNEVHFPTTVSHGQSEYVDQFPKEGQLEVLKSFSKLHHAHFRFRWCLVWMAPSGKTAPLPGPPNPSHSIHLNTKTKNFYYASNFLQDLFATQGQEGLEQRCWLRRTHMCKTGSANLTTLSPEFWKTKTTFQQQFLVGNLNLLSDFQKKDD
jgi:hypothetical protein